MRSQTFGRCLDIIVSTLRTDVTILSGRAPGPDQWGESYAKIKGHELRLFAPDWEVWGRSAGIRRNCDMAMVADEAIVFWDGESSGSKHMINEMIRKNKHCFVVLENGSIILWQDLIPR